MNNIIKVRRRLGAAKRAYLSTKQEQLKIEEQEKIKKQQVIVQEDKLPYYLRNDDGKTVADLKESFCCGCSACESVCPTKAIEMKLNDEGFWKPIIDSNKCVNCGLCKKTCPVINTPKSNVKDPRCIAVMANDEIRMNSSSGGVFSLLANHMLESGGYVCGVHLTKEFDVEHTIISDKKELPPLLGSKYVQSNINTIFSQIKELVKKGEQVLFTGTPCQVAGLNNFMGKSYDNLITVDLVCHGSPSITVFKQYLDDYYGLENLADFKFRTKRFGYNSMHQVATMKDGSEVIGNIKFDAYEKIMHTGVGLNDICKQCSFAPAPRQGDISIGDFWGVSSYNADLNDHKGTSVTLLNNEKGKAYFELIKDNAILVEDVPFSVAIRNNRFGANMRTPSGKKWLYHMMKHQNIDKAADYAINRKFDVGVIGLWYGRNYGSMATYYALHHTLLELGLSVLMIENPLKPNGEDEYTRTHPRKIANEYYDVSKKYPLNQLHELNHHCDTFVVGSDQLWNVGLSRPYGQMYYLGFVNDQNKKIAYSTSSGKEYKGTDGERVISSYNLQRFDHVSVRDELTKAVCKDEFGVDAVETCDPTFLCPVEAYRELADKAESRESEQYILAYILDPNAEIGKMLEKLAIEKKCKVIVLLDEPPWLWQNNVEKLELSGTTNVEVKSNIDLYEWLWHYDNATAVFTDSFHGTIFSIIFEKPFMTLINNKRGGQRFVSLLTPINLMDRLFDNIQEVEKNINIIGKLDYTSVNLKLNEIRNVSREWLKNALFAPKESKSLCVYKNSINETEIR